MPHGITGNLAKTPQIFMMAHKRAIVPVIRILNDTSLSHMADKPRNIILQILNKVLHKSSSNLEDCYR